MVVVGPDLLHHGTRTAHFTLAENDGRLHVSHRLRPEEIDDDLTGLLTDELFAPGWAVGANAFERIFTGIVLISHPDPVSAWELFYRNTMRRQAEPATGAGGHGAIADYAPVYHRVLALAEPAPMLDLGSCFGFLPLLLAQRGHDVVATDVSAGTVRLLDAVATRLGTPMRTLVADAARVPLPAGSVDTVTAIHLLEHLEPDHGEAVLAEALRLARRRVIIAVPFETEPDTAFGHRPTLKPCPPGPSWRTCKVHVRFAARDNVDGGPPLAFPACEH